MSAPAIAARALELCREREVNGPALAHAAHPDFVACAGCIADAVTEADGALEGLLAACRAAWVALPDSKHNEETNALLKAAILRAGGSL